MIERFNSYKNSDKLNIVCVGLYNHGKSSLLNVLVGDLDKNTFKVADKRETSEIKEVVKGNVIFVDTPGLDAMSEDDEKVKDAIKFRDVVLFVHNVATGELARNEVEFLERLKKEYGDNLYVILSRIDQIDDATLYKTKEKIKMQIGEIEVFEVSVNRYVKGKKENKKLLVKKSGIEELKKILGNLDFVEVRKDRIERLRKEILEDIEIKRAKLTKELKKIKKKKEEISKGIHSILETTKNKIKGA